MNKSQIEKQWGQVGLIRFGIKDNIPFTPISLQGIKQNKSYEYNPNESLVINILRYAVLAGTFTTEEIRYVFGKQGEQELEKMTKIRYNNKRLPKKKKKKKWEQFTKGR